MRERGSIKTQFSSLVLRCVKRILILEIFRKVINNINEPVFSL